MNTQKNQPVDKDGRPIMVQINTDCEYTREVFRWAILAACARQKGRVKVTGVIV